MSGIHPGGEEGGAAQAIPGSFLRPQRLPETRRVAQQPTCGGETLLQWLQFRTLQATLTGLTAGLQQAGVWSMDDDVSNMRVFFSFHTDSTTHSDMKQILRFAVVVVVGN